MRFFIEFAYNGTPFHGWQRQPNALSVQQTLEEGLSTVLSREIAIVGAGRTDTGVHARRMFAHFDYEPADESPRGIDLLCCRLVRSLNSIVGRDIAIRRVFPVAPDLHARFSAVSRTYKYFITFQPSPFLKDLSWYCPSLLNVDAMNEAAEWLTHVEDFTSFAKLHADTKTNICDVSEAFWRPLDSTLDFPAVNFPGIVFSITADRFLRNMVRAVVGTLLDVGRGKLSFDDFKNIINKKDRCAAGQSVPPQALFLWDVRYNEMDFIRRTLNEV
ncbi:MAG: tRNA pseudouridine(38-40) synthase TruA [Clostridium sp.]|nr:tRNA pseudouridine(38-40) synthase TruA [Prevotella sp.]MCM1429260.1 tRNA pseudouridine(38-40) synthase TruA [Clostridium sp.]